MDMQHLGAGEYTTALEGGPEQYRLYPRSIELVAAVTKHAAAAAGLDPSLTAARMRVNCSWPRTRRLTRPSDPLSRSQRMPRIDEKSPCVALPLTVTGRAVAAVWDLPVAWSMLVGIDLSCGPAPLSRRRHSPTGHVHRVPPCQHLRRHNRRPHGRLPTVEQLRVHSYWLMALQNQEMKRTFSLCSIVVLAFDHRRVGPSCSFSARP